VYHGNKKRLLLYSALALFLFIGGMSNFSFYYYLFFILGLIMMEAEHSGTEDLKLRLSSVYQFIFNSLSLAWTLLILSIVLEYFYQEHLLHYFSFFRLPLRAVAFILIVKNTKALRKFLSFKAFQFLGKISFAVYLLHLPFMLSLVSYIYLIFPPFFDSNIYVLFLIYFLIIIATSSLFYHFIELPSLKLAKRISARFGYEKTKILTKLD
jgi:peptidoglycan/LPS O-acetylase OafA/YrhL